MALTNARVREILTEAGVDSEHMRDAVTSIIDGHVASINAIREEESEKLSGVQRELDALKAQVSADAKEREGKDYNALKEEYDKYKQEVEAEKRKAAVTEKFTVMLKDMNVTDAGIAKILKWRGVDDVELDEDGKISNARDLRKSVKDEWPEYISTESVQGAQTPTPPVGTGAGRMTVDQIMSIKDDAERQTAIAKNLDLFGA